MCHNWKPFALSKVYNSNWYWRNLSNDDLFLGLRYSLYAFNWQQLNKWQFNILLLFKPLNTEKMLKQSTTNNFVGFKIKTCRWQHYAYLLRRILFCTNFGNRKAIQDQIWSNILSKNNWKYDFPAQISLIVIKMIKIAHQALPMYPQ